MALSLRGEGFRFLFRSDKGVVNREVWWLGSALLGAVVVAMTAIWLIVSPHATSDLSRRGLIDPTALVVYLFLMIHAFVVLVAAISWYNLSAKRFRDRSLAPGFAALPLVLALFSGALHWLQPRVPETFPGWTTSLLDILLLIVILWTIFELGIRPAADTPRA